MRKLGALLFVITCFLFNSIPVLASDIDGSGDDVWKQAYRELIITDAASLSPEMKERTSYHLMNVSDNGAPMMYISYGDYASGGRMCYYNDEGLHSEQTPDLYIAYVEGSDRMFYFWGHMGYYYEAAEQWDGKELTELGSGEYGADNGVLVDEDNGETAINTYIWEGEEVSREDYRTLRLALWDKMVESGGEVIYTGNVPEYDYDGMLDLLAVASVPEDPETAFKPVIDEYRQAITLGADALQSQYNFKYVGLGFGGYVPDDRTVYAFYDINQDGISEMLVGTGSDSGFRHIIEVFYFNSGEIGKLFDDTFNYRVGLHIGTDGTVMTEGSGSAFSELMSIYSVKDSFAEPTQTEGYYYDNSRETMFGSFKDEGWVELSQSEYYRHVNIYISRGLDYSTLDWYFFVTPAGGEYDPYPGSEIDKYEVSFSGFFAEQGYPAELTSQINFDSKHQRFIYYLNTWEDWIISEGTYTVGEDRTIECTVDINIDCFENKVDRPENQPIVHFSVNGDKITILEDVVGYGYEFYRKGDGFEITPDSGTGTVTGDAVRLRTGPGTDYAILDQLNSGDQVTIIGSSNGWYRIECTPWDGSFFRGFMRADYISRD